jgi:orotidine-5'-phosphate decarboxylase
MAPHFGDRLAAAVATRESQIVLGLDPDPARLWPDVVQAVEAADADATARAAAGVVLHSEAVIDAVASACVAVKLQVACFERLGSAGWHALHHVVAHARDAGLLVLADAKRGDIDVSAAAYGQAFLGSTATPWGDVEGLGADAMTASPYLGPDTLRPLVDAGRAGGRGVFVLVRTSNPGAADLQDLELASGGRVWERVAATVAELGGEAPGPDSGLTDVGAVTGATVPEHLTRLRELMPATVFLLPGVGAQGGRVEDLAPAFAPGRAAGLVTSSRGIVGAHESSGGSPADAARAEAERLRVLAWDLAG